MNEHDAFAQFLQRTLRQRFEVPKDAPRELLGLIDLFRPQEVPPPGG